MTPNKQFNLVVAGPTASGKSSLAIGLAKRFQAEILNIDSVQIYKGADIGSAKVSRSEQSLVKHHLIDIYSPDQKCDAGDFCRHASEVLKQTENNRQNLVWVAGTTLYLSGLLYGMADLPRADQELRTKLEQLSPLDRYELLKQRDPERAAELHLNDAARVVRALETVLLSGKKVSDLMQERKLSGRPVLILVLCWGREELYQRINQRTVSMIESGLAEEVKTLRDSFGAELSLFKTLGYKHALKFIEGVLNKEEMTQEIAMETRRFAKRQMTFWRNEPAKRGWKIVPDQHNFESQQSSRKQKGKIFNSLALSMEELCSNLQNRLSLPLDASEVWYLDPKPLFSI